MKHLKLIIFTLCLSLLASTAHAGSGKLKPYKGDLQSPAFTLSDVQGQSHNLSDYRGNVVLLQFWATYCTPCRKEMPTMNNLIKRMDGKPFKIVTVNMAEDKQSVEQFLDQVPVDFPVLMDKDGQVLGQWKVFAAPANFILDKQGNILYTLYGAIDWDSDDMVNTMTVLADR